MLGILGGGITAVAIVLWQNIDIRQVAPQLAAPALPVPLPESAADAAREGRTFDAVVFSSPRNQAYFPDPTYYRAALASWSALIQNTGGNVREVADAEGLSTLREQDLLVLAEAPCLATDEVAAVHAHLQNGGGVIANWAVGVRDADCEWTGWQTIMDLTGAEDVRELPTREGLFLTVPGGVALSPGFDPGTRIELRPDPSLALRLPGPRVYWSDWALNPQPDESGGGAAVAAVATYSALGGRITWFGHRLDQAATPADSARLSRLVQNGVAWAASVPTTAPAAWPGAQQAALVFTLDVEEQPQNALSVAAFLRERELPGTFYVVSQLLLEDPEMARALIDAGEVGSQTSDHTPLQGLTAQDQRVRLRRTSSEIEEWTGVAPTGLRPPEETFDPNTLDAWQRAGGTYLLATNESRSASPELHRVGDGTQVLLPRLLKDDYNIIVQDRVLRGTSLGQALLEGTRKMRAIGGLAIVAGHTQIMRDGSRIEALGTVADSALAQGDWWIARASDVADWWIARGATTVRFEPTSEGSSPAPVADIVVTAPLDRGVENLWIDVVIPSPPDGLIPLVEGRSVDYEQTDWGMRVPVGDLSAGATRRITYLVLEDGDDAAPSL
jgi:peptidoglycan/xylan/chitin deacetylase (PgdA/CDA1 family)